MSTYQWLLGFHVLGSFLFVSGAVVAGILQTAAMGRERPSEVALLLKLTLAGVVVLGIGALTSLGLGIWLVAHLPYYEIGDGWIVAALALWVVSGILGQLGGMRAEKARHLAERLAREGNQPSAALKRAVADPVALALNYASFVTVLAILGLMIWKP